MIENVIILTYLLTYLLIHLHHLTNHRTYLCSQIIPLPAISALMRWLQLRFDCDSTAVRRHSTEIQPCYNCRAAWKNRISSTTMKLRKSLVKPVTGQNISSCLVLPPEIVMHDAFNVILWTSADICVVVHDDLGWNNRTTRCNRF